MALSNAAADYAKNLAIAVSAAEVDAILEMAAADKLMPGELSVLQQIGAQRKAELVGGSSSAASWKTPLLIAAGVLGAWYLLKS